MKHKLLTALLIIGILLSIIVKVLSQGSIKSIFSDITCLNACFIGIEPGQTTVGELQTILTNNDIPWTRDVLGLSNSPVVNYIISTSTFPSPIAQSDHIIFWVGQSVESLVGAIQIPIQPTPLNSILEEYGAPTVMAQNDAIVALVYSVEGIVFLTYPEDYSVATKVEIRSPENIANYYVGTLPAITPCNDATLLCAIQTATPVPAILEISSLSLLDSTSLPITGHDPLVEGAVIDLGSVTASPLKFRANTNPATVGSVVFSLNGQVVGTSNTAPYDLNWTPLVGQHSLSATPYSGANGTGTAGTAYTVNFTVRQPRILYIHDGRIYSMNPDGTDSRVLVTGGSPAWSPDGTRIAYWGNSATGREIFVMNADGSNKTRLTYNNADDRNPSWSPNGNRIVYDSVVAGSDREIYVMNADGSNPVNITNNSVDDFDPSWSPTGDWIAFSSQAGDEDQIFIMRTNGNNRTRLTNSESNLVSPNWSPDGTIIVYTKLGTNTDIYRINADGTGGLRLTDNAASDQSPGWSADGTKILFSSLRNPGNNNYFELYWMNANGSGETRLTNTANVNEVAGVPAYP